MTSMGTHVTLPHSWAPMPGEVGGHVSVHVSVSVSASVCECVRAIGIGI
jgi:hypothetical protein